MIITLSAYCSNRHSWPSVRLIPFITWLTSGTHLDDPQETTSGGEEKRSFGSRGRRRRRRRRRRRKKKMIE